MLRVPQDTSAEEPDGGNLHVRFRGGPGRGDRPGLLNFLSTRFGVAVGRRTSHHAAWRTGRRSADVRAQ
jgi:hypothetical protein